MHARLSHYRVEPDRIDEAVRGFDDAANGLREIDGSEGGFLFVDREDGRLLSLTLWKNEASLSGSEVRAASLRRQAVQGAEGSIEKVECFEVALDFSAVRS